MRRGRALGLLGLLGLLLALAACDEARECIYDGMTLAAGASVDDEGRRLRCTCTAQGLTCVDLDGGPGLGDLAPPDAAPPVDAAPPADTGPDTPPDAAQPDASPPDAAPPSCPERAILAGSDCPGREGAVCLRGTPFDCCGRAVPGERRCACGGGSWSCDDLVAECESDPELGECGRRSRICGRWRQTRANRDPVESWGGDHERCDAGDMPPDWHAATLERINIFRAMAGLPAVEADRNLDAAAQACALAIRWHGTEDHRLEQGDRCYSPAAAQGVEGSLISRAPALTSVYAYMLDFGEQNFDALSHRLYLLSPQLGPIGIGTTSLASCVYVFGGRGPRDRPEWVAWPPPGPFPSEAALTDDAGWSVHSNTINLAFADVRVVADDGQELEIDARSLQAAGPAGWGLAWLPVGWQIEVGRSYRVEVTGGVRAGEDVDFAYTVEPIDCEAQ